VGARRGNDSLGRPSRDVEPADGVETAGVANPPEAGEGRLVEGQREPLGRSKLLYRARLGK